MPPLRVAAFQRHPRFDDVAGIGKTLLQDLEWADAKDVDLAVFPECYLQGYAIDRSTIERRALALDDMVLAGLLKRLGGIRATVILGMIERRGDAFYNSALTIKGGVLTGVYSKAHPNEQGFEPGTQFPVFEAASWPFGVNICNDANFPETAGRIANNGARLICYPLNNMLKPETAARWRGKSVENLRAIATQTGCWVASADVVGDHAGLTSYGCTLIVRPDGEIAARATELCEGVAIFDLL